MLASRYQRKPLRCLLCCGEEEERRGVAEGERRGQCCQSEGADQCLRHDAGAAGDGGCGDVRDTELWRCGDACHTSPAQ